MTSKRTQLWLISPSSFPHRNLLLLLVYGSIKKVASSCTFNYSGCMPTSINERQGLRRRRRRCRTKNTLVSMNWLLINLDCTLAHYMSIFLWDMSFYGWHRLMCVDKNHTADNISHMRGKNLLVWAVEREKKNH